MISPSAVSLSYLSLLCKMLLLHQRSTFFFYSSPSSQCTSYLELRFMLIDFDLYGVKLVFHIYDIFSRVFTQFKSQPAVADYLLIFFFMF
ncbi:hypothetical protein HanRHA438_Chr03g0105041 [Helianthus annuus]|nr:hypothetical protein HanRHA438_Chr03g0105041 [Helianthus annuus]KAJ0942303.1 hypothetical protein HanPSC8_Chr03g0090421 [Helianthus annuus]